MTDTPTPDAIRVFMANCLVCTIAKDLRACEACAFKSGLRLRMAEQKLKDRNGDDVAIEKYLSNLPNQLADLVYDMLIITDKHDPTDYPSWNNPYTLEWHHAEAMAKQFGLTRW